LLACLIFENNNYNLFKQATLYLICWNHFVDFARLTYTCNFYLMHDLEQIYRCNLTFRWYVVWNIAPNIFLFVAAFCMLCKQIFLSFVLRKGWIIVTFHSIHLTTIIGNLHLITGCRLVSSRLCSYRLGHVSVWNVSEHLRVKYAQKLSICYEVVLLIDYRHQWHLYWLVYVNCLQICSMLCFQSVQN